VAEVEPLYVLLTPVNPVTERAFFETVLEAVARLTLVAPVLLKTILPEYGDPATVAEAFNRTYMAVEAIVPDEPTVSA
jgi:hypothetical protein